MPQHSMLLLLLLLVAWPPWGGMMPRVSGQRIFVTNVLALGRQVGGWDRRDGWEWVETVYGGYV
jgi:hypothetical protein